MKTPLKLFRSVVVPGRHFSAYPTEILLRLPLMFVPFLSLFFLAKNMSPRFEFQDAFLTVT